MKICQFSSAHPDNDTRVFHRQCKTLAARGHEVTLVLAGSRQRTEGGVRILCVPRTRTSRWWRIAITAPAVMRLAGKQPADVYHFHDPELLPWALWLRLKGKCVVYDAHEDYVEDLRERPYMPRFGRGALIALASFVERASARRMSGVIGATDFITQKFAADGNAALAVHNFPRADELWIDGPRAPDERRVAYVGNIMRSRGIMEMLEACRLAGTTLMLAGLFETQELHARARAQPGWSQVLELGHLSRDALPGMLRGCVAGLVLFHPDKNWIVSEPLKLFEYMSAGLPVIVSNFELWRRIVETERCGLCVDPRDPGAIAEALRWICAHPGEAREMGERGRRAIRERFNWDREVTALEAFYAKLAGPNFRQSEAANVRDDG